MDQQITAVIINRKEHKLKVKPFPALGFVVTLLYLTGSLAHSERLWLPPGSLHGGAYAGRVLCNGLALVCSGHRPLHHPRQQSEAGVGVFGSRGAAQVSGNQRAAIHRPHDLHPYGLLSLHDVGAEGQSESV